MTMITNLTKEVKRHEVVMKYTKNLIDQGRNLLILSDRKEYVFRIMKELQTYTQDPIGIYIGGMKPQEMKQNKEYRILVGTYAMANEALDVPKLDALVLATPTLTPIIQSIGRVLRVYPNKPIPIVVDIVDPFSLFNGLRWRRVGYYQTIQADIRIIEENVD